MATGLLVALWEAAVLIAVSFYIAQISSYHPDEQIFPRLIAFPVAGLAIFSLLRRAWASRTGHPSDAAGVEPVDIRALTLAIAFAAGYVALWQWLGFVLDTLLLLTLAPWILGIRWKGVLGSAGIAVGVVALFGYLFGASGMATLPPGIFGIELRW